MSGIICFAELPPDELLSRTERSLAENALRLSAGTSQLLYFLAISVLAIAIGVVLIISGRMLIARLNNERSFKWEFFKAVFMPLELTAISCGIYCAYLPLCESVPPGIALWIRRVFCTAVVSLPVWGCCRVISVFNRKLSAYAERQDNHLDKLTVSMFGNMLKVSVTFCAILFICQNIFGLNISALLAGAGVVGLALALAAKDTVSNFFGTLVIIADSPFRIGDRIECQNISGIVQEVGMRSTRMILDDESVCTIPNSVLTNTVLRRINPRYVLKRTFDLALTYSTAPEQLQRAKAILHEILDDLNGKDAPGHQPHIFFASFGSSSLNIHVIVWLKCTSFFEEEALVDRVNTAILQRFNAEKLEFAYPTQTVFLEKSGSK